MGAHVERNNKVSLSFSFLFFFVANLRESLLDPPWSCFSRHSQGTGTRNGPGHSS